MTYPELVAKYLGSRTDKQLANDIKNLTEFEAKGGSAEILLSNTRNKIFSEGVNKLESGRSALQESLAGTMPVETPATAAARNYSQTLKEFQETANVPQYASATEEANAALRSLVQQRTTAPSALRESFRQLPVIGESVAQMLKRYTDPASKDYLPDFTAIRQLVSAKVATQKKTLSDALSTLENLYDSLEETAKTASTERQKKLDAALATASKLYDDFQDVQNEIAREERGLGIFEKKEAIKARYDESRGGIGGLTAEEQNEIDTLAELTLEGKSIGNVGASKLAKITDRAEEIAKERELASYENLETLGQVIAEAEAAGKGLGDIMQGLRAVGVRKELIDAALKRRAASLQAKPEGFFKRLWATDVDLTQGMNK